MDSIQNEKIAVFLEKLPTLIAYLRFMGYPIGNTELAKAQQILKILQEQNQLPTQFESFHLWLKPVLCHSPLAQENFLEHFTYWLEENSLTEQVDPKITQQSNKIKSWQWIVLGIGIVSALSLSLTTYWLNHAKAFPAVDEQRKLSVTVNEMPVNKILLALARDMDIDVDINPTIQGKITLDVTEQTFSQLLKNIARQANIHYQLTDNLLTVLPGARPLSFQSWIGYLVALIVLLATLLILIFPFKRNKRKAPKKPLLPRLKPLKVSQPVTTTVLSSMLDINKAVLTAVLSNPRLAPHTPQLPPLVWDSVSLSQPSTLFYFSVASSTRKIEILEEKEEIPTKPVELTPTSLIIAFYVVARTGRQFSGTDIFTVLEEMHFDYGEMNIFHCYHLGDLTFKQPVLSIANLIEPGIFDREQMNTFTTPGLAIFMQLPSPFDGRVAFEFMLNTSYRLATVLEGRVENKQRRPLDAEIVNTLRQKVAEFEELK